MVTTDSATTDIVVKALKMGLEDAPQLSAVRTFLTEEPNYRGYDSEAYPPVCHIKPVSESRVSDGIGVSEHITDATGNEIGYIYEWVMDLRLQIDLYTIDGEGTDIRELGDGLKLALFKYDEAGHNQLLPHPTDPSDTGIDAISLWVGTGKPAHTTGFQGSDSDILLHRWRQDVMTQYTRKVSTVEEYGEFPYIRNVDYPGDGDYTGDPNVEDGLHAVPPHGN